MNRNEIKVGDILSYWHDGGWLGMTLLYATVEKVCPTLIKVRGECGKAGYKYPWFFFDKVPNNAN